MADGVLYAWLSAARPDGTGATLAWSADRGQTWECADWTIPQLGSPAWLNHGRNNAGGPDGYLYFYSPDTSRAGTAADGLILGRVRQHEARDRGAYRYFCGFDSGFEPRFAIGDPVWTPDYDRRTVILTNQRRCMRTEAVYNATLGLYLLLTSVDVPKHDSSAELLSRGGSLAVFVGPQPWGPWNTVHFDDGADAVYTRRQPRLPVKWIGDDGTTLYLVTGAGDERGAPGECGHLVARPWRITVAPDYGGTAAHLPRSRGDREDGSAI
jgi:hypothetical protein